MRSLIDGAWDDCSLDFHRASSAVRIQVEAFTNLEPVVGMYFVLPRSKTLVWNYIREVGPIETWRKVTSRMQERNRNNKFQSFGVGKVIDCDRDGEFSPGDVVLFIAPASPQCIERVVLPEFFLAHAESGEKSVLRDGKLLYLSQSSVEMLDTQLWSRICGWNEHSGQSFSPDDTAAIAEELHRFAREINLGDAREFSIDPSTPIREVYSTLGTFVAPRGQKKRAVLFGYGHYAKTNIMPNVKKFIDIEAVHEIDPLQVPKDWGKLPYWDSSPTTRPTEEFDVYFLAGYHHTHAPLAVEAMKRGAYAVVEKPIAVDHGQLQNLLGAIKNNSGGLFACFHKRYSSLNSMALEDLGHKRGEPINYNCIVYEVPLPEMHWYRWPNSKSRLISNGCHWIDHFLYLNDYVEIASSMVGTGEDGTINCSVALKNGAYFTMVLTDTGSQRIGLQDYVELRSKGVTVKITNNSRYFSENRFRVIRRTGIKKTLPYKLMYRSIAGKIAEGHPGDSEESVRVSSQLILELEDLFLEGTGGKQY